MNGLNNVEPVNLLKSNNMQTVTLQEDPLTGDLYFQLPEDVVLELGWGPGDTIEWTEIENGAWTLKKYVPTVE